MKLTDLSLRNHQFTIVAIVLLVLYGITGYMSMPRSEDPFMKPPAISVFVIVPGATPEDIETQILDPLDKLVRGIEDVKHTDGTTRPGTASLAIQFEYGSDQDELLNKVEEQVAIARTDFPEGVMRVEVIAWSTFEVRMMQIALVSETRSMHELKQWSDELEQRLDVISGLRGLRTFGLQEEEVRVAVHPERLAESNIPLVQVIGAIEAAGLSIPGGAVDIGERRFNVLTSGDFDSVEQIRKVVVAGTPTSPVYLSDVADVNYAYEDRAYLTRTNGKRCVLVTAQQKENTNVTLLMGAVHEEVATFAKALPPDIELIWVFDQSEHVAHRLDNFFRNLFQGIVLVGIVVLLVLGFRSASIVMLTIPLSFIIAMGWIASLGYAIQQMTIAAMVLALGLLVDNSIVITENINSFLVQGYSRFEAARRGAMQVGWAVVSATATTILAFVPIAMMEAESGQFIRSMPISVMLILFASLIVALTFSPLLASRILKPIRTEQQPRTVQLLGRFINGPYRRLLRWVLGHRWKTIVATVLALVITFALFPLVGVSFFPKADKPIFIVDIVLPKGSSLDATNRALTWAEDILLQEPDIVTLSANLGRGQPSIYYNLGQALESSNYAQLLAQTKPDIIADKLQPILERLRNKFDNYSGARIEVRELEQGPGSIAPIVVRVHGRDMAVLERLTGEIEQTLRLIPGAINVQNPLSDRAIDLQVKIDRDRAALLGADLRQIDMTVRAAIAGWQASTYRDPDGEEYAVNVRLPAGEYAKAEDFSRIFIPTALGKQVPLAEVAKLELKSGHSEIRIRDGERIAIVTSDVANRPTSEIEQELHDKLDQMQFPPGYWFDFGGESESRGESFSSMYQATTVAIVGIYAVLVLMFGSFRQPLIIFTALPLAFIGAILGLLFSGNSFSFTAFVGLTSLVGIVVNNSILLVDRANQLRQEQKSIHEAVLESGMSRFTPILLTTGTTVLGLLPLTLTGGTLWAPLGWVIIGGLLTSTILTLVVVPVLYDLYSEKDVKPVPEA